MPYSTDNLTPVANNEKAQRSKQFNISGILFKQELGSLNQRKAYTRQAGTTTFTKRYQILFNPSEYLMNLFQNLPGTLAETLLMKPCVMIPIEAGPH